MDERIYARGLYHETKDSIDNLQKQIKDIKTLMLNIINSDTIDTDELRVLTDDYDAKSSEVSNKWMEVQDLKKIWGFR
jgi:hypothetical protein